MHADVEYCCMEYSTCKLLSSGPTLATQKERKERERERVREEEEEEEDEESYEVWELQRENVNLAIHRWKTFALCVVGIW